MMRAGDAREKEGNGNLRFPGGRRSQSWQSEGRCVKQPEK
jgi:hypothetical protein